MLRTGASEVPPGADLLKEKMNHAVSVDVSWGLRVWASKKGIVDICFADTGKN